MATENELDPQGEGLKVIKKSIEEEFKYQKSLLALFAYVFVLFKYTWQIASNKIDESELFSFIVSLFVFSSLYYVYKAGFFIKNNQSMCNLTGLTIREKIKRIIEFSMLFIIPFYFMLLFASIYFAADSAITAIKYFIILVAMFGFGYWIRFSLLNKQKDIIFGFAIMFILTVVVPYTAIVWQKNSFKLAHEFIISLLKTK